MSKKTSRMSATIMLAAVVFFIAFALNHPEKAFPWDNGWTYGGLVAYIIAMAVLFVAPFKNR